MSKEDTTTFGECIRNLRERAGLPLRKMAAQLDVDPSLLGKIERNNRRPTRKLIKKLARTFGQSESHLLSMKLSDEIAFKILKEKSGLNVLRVAEKKVDYLRSKRNV